MVPISTFWIGRCIWMRVRPTSMSAMCLTAKTGMGAVPQQEKALEELGLNCLIRVSPRGKHNNRKQTFDAVCRTLLFDISRKHGVHLEQEPSYGGRAYLEKQDYILMKQKELLAAQEQKLEELTLKN